MKKAVKKGDMSQEDMDATKDDIEENKIQDMDFATFQTEFAAH